MKYHCKVYKSRHFTGCSCDIDALGTVLTEVPVLISPNIAPMKNFQKKCIRAGLPIIISKEIPSPSIANPSARSPIPPKMVHKDKHSPYIYGSAL